MGLPAVVARTLVNACAEFYCSSALGKGNCAG